MNSAMAWSLQQHRGPEEDLVRGIGPGVPGGYPSSAPQLFGPSTTSSTSSYYGRPLAIGGPNSRASQHMLTIEGVDDAAGDGGGGPFTQCVEPQPQRPPSERFGRVGTSQAQENGGSENDNGGASEISASGPGTSTGNGCFMPDSVLNMIGSSPGYSPPHIEGQQHHHHQHHPQNFPKRDSHNPGQGRSSVAGMWPTSHGHFDDWGALLDRSTPPMPTSHSQQMTSSGFSSPHWSSTHTIAEKQTWTNQPHFQPYDRPPSSHQQQHQHPEDQHRRDGQSDTMHDQHLKHDATLQSYGNNGYLPQQQQQPPRHLVNGWSSPRTGLPRPLSPPNTSALEVSTLRSPAPVALAAANAVGLEDPEGTYSAQEDSASGVGGGGDVDGGIKAGVRPSSGAPAGGERATKLARTMSDKKVEERGNDGSGGDGGGVKADGTGGGGAAKISAPRKRSGEDSLRDLTPEERLRLNRERNRDHSRRSRERKKAYVEGLKKQVSELGAYRMLVEEAHDLISAHSTDVNAVFTFASGGFDRLLGMDPSELLGVSFLELVDPNDSQEVLRSVLATLRRGGIRQVQYRMRPPAGAHAAEVETSFRLVSTRLVAVTRVRGRSPSACDTLPPPPAALPSLTMTSAPGSSHVPPPSPLLVQPLPSVSGMRVDGGAGGLSLPAEFSGDW